MTRDVIAQLLVFALGGGLVKFVTDLYGVRRQRRLEGPETAGIVTKGAESAVLSLQAALEASDRQVAALRAEVGEVRDELATTRAELAAARADAAQARVEAAALREEVHELTDELHGYVHRPPQTRGRATDRQKETP